MFEIEVNHQTIAAEKGETILNAVNRAGIEIPTLCHMRDLVPSGACRMCVVEVEGYRNLVTSCCHPVQEGMKIQTNSSRAVEARKTILELLLANHPDDCLYCVRSNDCQLQNLSADYGIRERHFHAPPRTYPLDISSASIVRDQSKCILCGRCVRTCEEVMAVSAIDFIRRGSDTVIGPAFNESLNVSSCVNCGQCILACPTGALREQSHVKRVWDALQDPNTTVVVQHAPAISVTLAEEFNLDAGQDVDHKMVAALRRLGFDYVFDTSFSADLTILEEASELVHRIQNNGPLPMFTSCSPAWIKYVEQFYPEFIPNLSTCKSPQQMLGALVKSYWADQNNIDPKSIFSVSIMPCTAKKFEAQRPGMGRDILPDLDASLTTRELARMLKTAGIDLNRTAPVPPDQPFGERSTAGKIFGASGGVMEAALRTAYHLITGSELDQVRIASVRGNKGIRTAQVPVGDLTVGVAVANGLKNAKMLLEEIKAGRDDIQFIEVMSCPGGCIAGGGQPLKSDPERIRARTQSLYKIDQNESVQLSHKNTCVQALYRDFLDAPLGEKSHQLLHTEYETREVLK